MATKTKSGGKAADRDRDVKTLIPGVKIPILEVKPGDLPEDAPDPELVDGVAYRGSVTVFPLGLRQARKFTSGVAGLFSIIGDVRVKVDDENPKSSILSQVGTAALIQAIPFILSNLMDLVDDCCRVVIDGGEEYRVSDLPHWEVPPVIDAWLMESFGSERKWGPWLQVVESLGQRITGQDLNLRAALEGLASGTSETDSPS